MKIVVLDGYSSNPGDMSWKELEEMGQLKVYDRTADGDIQKRIEGVEAVLTNKTPLDRETIENADKLKYIGVLATGYNIVDVKAASEKGIVVTNIPDYSTKEVAQFVFALLLELCHHVGSHDAAVKEGEWTKCEDFTFWKYPLIALSGKTMGIIGMGSIGYSVAKLADAFGMKVIYHSRSRNRKAESKGFLYRDFEKLLEDSDVVSLNCPLNDQTRGMIDMKALSKMKKSAFLINTARGPIVNEKDLAQALEQGIVAGAAVDVLSKEPPDADNPLLDCKKCIITPHIAWAAKDARDKLMEIAVNNLSTFLNGNPQNTVK